MFRKIVSQLSFSPALVGQLSFYAKRLRKEQFTRRLGLVFVALALVVQSLVVFQAPEPANAANASDFIPGGLGIGSARSLNNFLGPYDRNERNLKDVFNYFGITREEIVATQFTSFQIGHKISWGYENRAGSTGVTITNSNGQAVNTVYGRGLAAAWGYSLDEEFWGYVGYSAKFGWFAILQSCGNLVTDVFPPPPPPPKPANIVSSKSGVNVTQGSVDATKTAAKVNDLITYTVKASNTGGTAKEVTLSDDLTEVVKYAKLTNPGGGSFNQGSKVLSWGAVNLTPGASVTKQYTVQMNSSLVNPTTDCKMTNTFLGNSVTVPVNCVTPPANIVASKTAYNASLKMDATKTAAKENNKITYTVSVSNTGGTAKKVSMKDDLSEVLAFTKLTDAGGGTLDQKTQTLSWPEVTVAPKQTVKKTYTVQLKADLTNPTTDCKMTNQFLGKSVTVRIQCKTPPADIVVNKTALNVSQGNTDATKTTAKAGDRITFTLTATNKGGTAKQFTFSDTISDAIEYATVIDNGGGTVSQNGRTISWPAVTLKPGAKEVRTFTMQLLAQIPATPSGLSEPSSYDCRIENTFFDAHVVIPVECPAPKVIETVVPELPHTGPGENMLFAGILLAVVTFFYYRSKQLGTEVRLIRRDVNGGTI